ncbi:amino acid permease/ SLC12A domain-containing protein [Fusarium oxysporum II5]|nr:uncharacterized protein FOIG_10987 [Fusarium odoratissimum NRRL 54006]EXL96610.1 hypothetical protein FOIG_10987 [Fusarium odoratissimum NRRL 54006]KAK2136216.1 amino acid permease/ SLC12A domain-containing protein [Fusarium oxysporum II5]TXC05309.1 hypothetical protein FocTR4_00000334 [Fusarium oxysporum f. sp. cubense]
MAPHTTAVNVQDGAKESPYPPSPRDSFEKTGDVIEAPTDHVASTLHRRLTTHQIQLLTIGGAIGSGVFVAMGGALATGGPASLILGYLLQTCLIGMANNCVAEMVCFMPVPAAFIQHATRWVDPALGFMVGWNYYFYIALGIPFELVGTSLILGFWRDDIPVAAVICVLAAIYVFLNVFAVNWYGVSESWLTLGKLLLFVIVFLFTLITMSGGNPQRDAYGFRNWSPGAFLEYLNTGSLGKFQGFLSCWFQSAFVVVGPDYVSTMAGEAKNPRVSLKKAYKTMYARFAVFFVGSALCIGIVVRSNDPTLVGVLNGTESGAGTGAASPYVIAAKNMNIAVLPSIINALLLTSLVSAGNNFVFSATRGLYGMALNGQAPKFLQYTTQRGVPIYCLGFTMLFSAIAFLQLNDSSAKVYYWIVNCATAAGIINYIVMSITYVFFYRALKKQNIDRSTLPYRGWGQPYMSYVAIFMLSALLLCFGYQSFTPVWSIESFFIYYTFLLLGILTYTFWKVIHRTKFVKPEEADLIWAHPEVDAHEAFIAGEQEIGFWRETAAMVGIKKYRNRAEENI